MKKNIIYLASAILGIVLSVSCIRDEIQYPKSNYYLRMNLDEVKANLNGESEPDIYMVSLYDTETGVQKYNQIVRPANHPEDMPLGAYMSIVPGKYELVVYNFDNKKELIDNEGNIKTAYMHTRILGYNGSTPIVSTPDQFFCYNEIIDVKYVTDNNVYFIDAKPVPIIERWNLNINGIKNLDKLQKADIYLSGQARGKMLGIGNKKLDEHAIICFEYVPVITKAGGSGEILQVSYMTFGTIEDGRRSLLTIQFEGPDGSQYYAQEDITKQILDPENTEHEINITADIKIEEKKQGGFNPHAEEWDEDKTKIELS